MAVLALLRDRPRHPYEMKALLQERHVGAAVRLRGGSLYDAIGRLTKAGLIEPVQTGRQGARPERTVYALTPAGAELLDALVHEYVGTVAEEFPVFVAGLAHLALLPAGEVATLLAQRAETLRAEVDRMDSMLAGALAADVPRVVLLEGEYAQAIRRAEINWLDGVVRDIQAGELPWIDLESDEHSEEQP
jgi:DNA-binding PadR family transcriptional regulator